MESSKKKNEEILGYINRYRDEFNTIKHHLVNVEMAQKEWKEGPKELTYNNNNRKRRQN